jgi:hypothetical protein
MQGSDLQGISKNFKLPLLFALANRTWDHGVYSGNKWEPGQPVIFALAF